MQARSTRARVYSWLGSLILCSCLQQDRCVIRQSNNLHVYWPVRGSPNGPRETNQMHQLHRPITMKKQYVVIMANSKKLLHSTDKKIIMNQINGTKYKKQLWSISLFAYDFISWLGWLSIAKLNDFLRRWKELRTSGPWWTSRMILAQIWGTCIFLIAFVQRQWLICIFNCFYKNIFNWIENATNIDKHFL